MEAVPEGRVSNDNNVNVGENKTGNTTNLTGGEPEIVTETNITGAEPVTVTTTNVTGGETGIVAPTNVTGEEPKTVTATNVTSGETGIVVATNVPVGEPERVAATNVTSGETGIVATTNVTGEEPITVTTTNVTGGELGIVTATNITGGEHEIVTARNVVENEEPEGKEKTSKSRFSCFERNSKGGWSYALLLLANQGLATLAFFGVGVNLVLFLTRVLDQNNAAAANNVSKWTGTVYLFSLVGAFLSDSYWGRYLTCAIFQVILVVGLVLLSLSSWLFLIKPAGCGNGKQYCDPTTSIGSVLFYLAIYLVAFGYGGHQPTIATFGADQFEDSNPKQKGARGAFFAYFYFALNTGSLFSNTILVYYEDKGKWTLGFWVSTASAVLALVLFLLGSPGYRYVKPCGNPLPRVTQVFFAAARKWRLNLPEAKDLYEVEGRHSAIKGARKILHTDEFECLDKAAVITPEDQQEGSTNPWRLCTVTQVEEAKCIIRMIPIWLCTIVYSVVFTQMASLFVEQGDVMNSQLGNFHLPAASMSIFDICSVLICTGLYRQVLVPVAGRLSGNPKGLSELQRMGVGLVIGLLSMIAAGVTEMERLKRVTPGKPTSSLSIFWQIPQYVLVGSSEVFMYVGQLEFFNGQAPDGIKSFGSSLCMASISLGNYVSSLLVNMVMGITAKGDNPGWIPHDLNSGHMDRFYFLIAALTAVDFVIYLWCAKWYKCVNLDADPEVADQETTAENEQEMVSRA